MQPCRTLAFGFLLGVLTSTAHAQSVTTYRVETKIAEKSYRVQIDIPNVRETTVRVQMPMRTAPQ